MSRLDDHVSAVRNKLALARFVQALAWGSLVWSSAALLGVLVDRVFLVHPPRPQLWLWMGGALTMVSAVAYALYRRPGAREAAVAIDQKLGLKEKISTALYVRHAEHDPFARAAVLDAEHTAQQVVINLRQHFPMSFPRPAYATIVVALAAVMAYFLIDPMRLFGREEKLRQQVAQQQKVEAARKTLEKALATVDAMPRIAQNEQTIRLARAEIQAMLAQPITDPAKATRTAVKALQDVNEALKQQVKSSAKYAQAQNEMKLLKSMQVPIEGQGPIADAHRAIAKGEFTAAIDELSKAIENFEKMDKQQQKQAAEQMQQLAQQLNQMANNPAQQQKLQQQLQQLGMNQQQAQQAQQLMQQAAQGDQQAMQQLQQMAQQMMQQMNNGQGPNPQQQQAIQQMMQQMQAQMNAQQQAAQMAQAAQQLAQAMQQAQQAQQGQQGQQNQPQQQGQQNQQMAQAMAQMQQQLQQMQAAAQDAQQIAAAQAACQAAQADAQNAMNGNNPGGQGDGGGQWNANANLAGNNQQQGQLQPGFAGPNPGGIGAGDRTYKSAAPFGVKPEISPSQDDEKGKLLASSFIKDNKPFKGASIETLKQVAESALKEQTDEVEQERISRQAQRAVREYFNSMEKEAAGAAAPAP
ncbi:hypothetical protein [Fontivita pretiosa]|uniref:hypothetical protein n=1 Tax=Fontivita pretiosa TaxID=2989684 RepID=UPI003D1705F3